MNLILMRLPGVDKDTRAEKIIDTYGIPHIPVGDMFRATMKDETTLDLEAKFHIDKGELVPNEATNGIVKERFAEPGTDKEFLLNGFPRTPDQAKALDTMLKELNKRTDTVIDIYVEGDILIECLAGQFICCTCGATCHRLFNPPKVESTCDHCGKHESYQREGGKSKTVKDRLATNIGGNTPILAFYKEQDLMHTIDGNREINTVLSDVKEIIDEN